jgi:Na+-driven multidrug efflux pump
MAVGTFTAQNYGAGRIDRVKRGVTLSMVISVSFSIVMGGIVFFGGHAMSGLFIEGGFGEVQRYAQTFLRIGGAMYIFLALLFVYRFALQGLGKPVGITVGAIAELVMRIFSVLVLARMVGFIGICLAGPLAWIGAAVPIVILYYVTIKKLG